MAEREVRIELELDRIKEGHRRKEFSGHAIIFFGHARIFTDIFPFPPQDFCHYAGIFPVIFQSPLYITVKLPSLLTEGIPAYLMGKTVWVTVKIFIYSRRNYHSYVRAFFERELKNYPFFTLLVFLKPFFSLSDVFIVLEQL